MLSASPSVIQLSYWWALETNLRKPGFTLPPGWLVGVVTGPCVPASVPDWHLPGSVSPAGNLCLSSPPSFFSVLSIHYADSLVFLCVPSGLPVPCVHSIPYLSETFLLFIRSTTQCVRALDKLQNTQGINHCHLAARHVAHAAKASQCPARSHPPPRKLTFLA